MTPKAVLRRVLLLPLQPIFVRFGIGALRYLRLLPKRVSGEWPPKRVLIINLTRNLGDALMMLPMVDALRRAAPSAAINLIIDSPMDVPLRAVPSLRKVFCFGSRRSSIALLGHYFQVWQMFLFARRRLKDETYDLVLLPRWGNDPSLAGYLAAMTTAPRRCGHDPSEETTAHDAFRGMAILLTDVSHGGLGMAEGVREQLVLVACGLVHHIDPEAEEHRTVESVIAMSDAIDVDVLLRRLDLPGDETFVLLAPGASHAARRWPPEHFASLGAALYSALDVPVFSIGSPIDEKLGQQIEQLSGGLVRNLAGQTSILESVALTRKGSMLVTNDSGPAHLGGSLGIPTLVLSVCPSTNTVEHANSPLRVRPVGPQVTVMQPERNADGCSDRCVREQAHCILGLSVEAVFAQAMSTFSAASERPGGLKMERSTRAGAPAATL